MARKSHGQRPLHAVDLICRYYRRIIVCIYYCRRPMILRQPDDGMPFRRHYAIASVAARFA